MSPGILIDTLETEALPVLGTLRLTEDLVARAWRAVPESARPSQGYTPFADADREAHLMDFLRDAPASPVHVFAYGSLLWRPEYVPAETRPAIVAGWRRSFCLRVRGLRGTPEQPGLMMALDRGGRVEGVLHRLDPDRGAADLRQLWRREMPLHPPANVPVWVTADTEIGPLTAIAFAAEPGHFNYLGGLSADQTANVIASACGSGGSCAEYLRNTILSLEEYAIHDPYLWELQDRVADRLERLPG